MDAMPNCVGMLLSPPPPPPAPNVPLQAPEVVLGQPYNEKVDVFSFGVLAYELLARSMLLFTHVGAGPLRGVNTPGAAHDMAQDSHVCLCCLKQPATAAAQRLPCCDSVLCPAPAVIR